jgi:hypothetical protein
MFKEMTGQVMRTLNNQSKNLSILGMIFMPQSSNISKSHNLMPSMVFIGDSLNF